MKVIFLDFDGVLLNRASFGPPLKRSGMSAKANPACIAVLNQIVERSDAKICVSSTWRIGPQPLAERLQRVRDYLKAWGVDGEVIGITPYREAQEQRRGIEISDWLRMNPHVGNFVILDDEDDMAHLKSALVQTTFELGLTQEHVLPALRQLGVYENLRLDDAEARCPEPLCAGTKSNPQMIKLNPGHTPRACRHPFHLERR